MSDAAQRFLFHKQTPLSQADVVFVSIPFAGSVSYMTGTQRAPEAIIAASHQLEYFEEERGWSPTVSLACHHFSVPWDGVEPADTYLRRVHEGLRGRRADSFVVALGGEHTVTLPVVEAVLPEGGTVVTIDAHPDLRDRYQDSPLSHACVMRRLVERGYRIIQIGLGCISEEERAFVDSRAEITQFFSHTLADDPDALPGLLRMLTDVQGPVYLSVDADGLDTGIMPGVGTPVPGGLTWHVLRRIVRTLCDNRSIRLRGADIVEVRPLIDQPLSEFTAAKLVQKILSYRFHPSP